MSLSDHVRIAARFQRAVRIDLDLHNPNALDGFACTGTFERTLGTVAEQWAETGHAAFTWTGPYGGGKSSLVLAFAGLLGPRGRTRDQARKVLGEAVSHTVTKAFKSSSRGWRVLPVMGARAKPSTLVWEALIASGAVRDSAQAKKAPADAEVLAAIERCAKRDTHDGLLIVFDELGKVLEYLAATGGDLHFFQELAERASRSNRRIMVLGILHQAFEEYVGRLGKDVRGEWAKVQGRFLDIPLAVTGLEQIEIISRAMVSEPPKVHRALAEDVGRILKGYRPDAPRSLSADLLGCWPLHPVTACLLGPISRRRFGQNQRSIFAFLNSYEPKGFRDFLVAAGPGCLFSPDQLFDYLQINLEPAILASPDGHRWSLALEAVARAEKRDATALQLRLLKSIAMLDLFRDRSGLYASKEVLATLARDASEQALRESLDTLKSWSLVTYREHLSAFAIFAGSDFDLTVALDSAAEEVAIPDLAHLRSVSNLRPIVAKRHYHDTGAMRWFDVDVVEFSNLDKRLADFKPNGAMGQFLLVVDVEGNPAKRVVAHLREISASHRVPIALGLCTSGSRLVELCREFACLEHIRKHRPELASDAVARREVEARAASVTALLEVELREAFSMATWFVGGSDKSAIGLSGLTRLASTLADDTYPSSPRVHNELLNRSAPSSNAIAAQKALLRAMVGSSLRSRLGIDAYPAEGGLYDSLLSATGLHVNRGESARFAEPAGADPAKLSTLWRGTDAFLKESAKRPISAAEIYALWEAPPFGVREGLRPIFLVAYLLTRADRYTVYLDSQMEVALTDVTTDRLSQDPANLHLRLFDPGERERRLLRHLNSTVTELAPANIRSTDASDAVQIAKGVVSIVKLQPLYALRTQSVSKAAISVRSALRSAEDPQLLIHETLPNIAAELLGVTQPSIEACGRALHAALHEVAHSFPAMLRRLEQILFAEIGSNDHEQLRERAQAVKGLTGDFRVEAFAARLQDYAGKIEDIEGIASLAASKPAREFTDNDVDRVAIEIAELAQRFNRAEAFARVKGRPDGRHAIAFVIGLDRSPQTISDEFEITEKERREALGFARELREFLERSSHREEITLAAIAQVGSDLVSNKKAHIAQAVNG